VAEIILVPASLLSVGNLALCLIGSSVLPYRGKVGSFATSLILGMSLLCVTSYVLNLAQLDLRYFYWGFFFLGIAHAIYILFRFPWKNSARLIGGLSGNEVTIVEVAIASVVILAIVSLISLSTFNPGSDWDAVQLYLPMGKIVFEKGFLPAHSQEIGRDIVNFFLMGYAYGYAMTISGDFLFPPSILAISAVTLLGLVATTYEIAWGILRTRAVSLIAVAFTVTLPILAFYFAWTPRYVDVPSVFLAFGLILLVMNCIGKGIEARTTMILRNSCFGLIAFTAIGFKLQNLLILAPLAVLIIESITSIRKRALALLGLSVSFVFSIQWGLSYGTILSGLSSTGILSPIFVIVTESSLLLLSFVILSLRKPAITTPVVLKSFLPGVIIGFAIWFVRPWLLESTPFFPASLPNTPAYESARQTYSSIVRSLFPSSPLQYGLAIPYAGSDLAPLMLPLVLLGGYGLLRRRHLFVLKWVLLLNAAAILLTGYVDSRYALWTVPLSGILIGESIAFLKKRTTAAGQIIPLTVVILMSLGLGINSASPTIQAHIIPWFVLLPMAGLLYATIYVRGAITKCARKIRLGSFNFRLLTIATILVASIGLSIFAVTYSSLIIDDSKLQGLEPKYEEVYGFLRGNVSKGSTVLSVGFPGIYYRTGLNSVPLDDPEGLARLYPFTMESNLTIAVKQLTESGVSSIIVPTNNNSFWYGYFQSLKSGLPIVRALTTEPASRRAFVGSNYEVYLLS
jgi:hypothetical protein